MEKKIFKIKTAILFIAFFINQSIFSQTTTGCWKTFTGGNVFALGITTNGELWSWGYNNWGQLGLGTQESIGNPIKSQIGTENQWKEVAAGYEYALAIKNDGTLWAWGANYFGMLGDGTYFTRISPVQIGSETNWSKIATGEVNSLALKTDGTLWAWGRNNSGQLGDGTNTEKLVPIQVGVDSDWKEISVGTLHCIALKSNGTLWTWGENGNGQLGLADNLYKDKNIPTQVGTATNWNKISAGRNFNLALKNDGTLWSWGQNDFGQLGNGFSFGNFNDTPTQRGSDTDWKEISAGDLHSTALKTNGTRWAWGGNGSGSSNSGNKGALGDNTIIDKNIPIQIGTDTDWQKPNNGIYFSLFLKNDGTLWSNGTNFSGELGDGTKTTRLSPTLVTCPITLSNKRFEDINFSFYPNPTTGIISISNQNNLTIDKIEIVDVLGKTVATKTENTSQVDISHLSNGIYIFKIYSGETVSTKKIIKQ